MTARPLRVGLDARPALVNREGIGRYARELVRSLLTTDGDERLRLFGATLAAARADQGELGLPHPRARLVRWRVPSRALARALRVTRLGVDDLVGGCDLFHQLVHHTIGFGRHVHAAINLCQPVISGTNRLFHGGLNFFQNRTHLTGGLCRLMRQ